MVVGQSEQKCIGSSDCSQVQPFLGNVFDRFRHLHFVLVSSELSIRGWHFPGALWLVRRSHPIFHKTTNVTSLFPGIDLALMPPKISTTFDARLQILLGCAVHSSRRVQRRDSTIGSFAEHHRSQRASRISWYYPPKYQQTIGQGTRNETRVTMIPAIQNLTARERAFVYRARDWAIANEMMFEKLIDQ